MASQSDVDHQVKKLDGVTVFKLILFSLLHHSKASLRIMEQLYSSMQFRLISKLENQTICYSSISDRIATINSAFFEQIFLTVFDRFSRHFKEQDALLRYDSTMISISSSLVDWGMKVGNIGNKAYSVSLKYTIGTKGSFPCHVKIFDSPKGLSEDVAIPSAIFENDISKTGVIVFDRGLRARKAFQDLSQSDRLFVTRVSTDVRYQAIKERKLNKKNNSKSASVIIKEDLEVLLKDKKEKWTSLSFRLIKAVIKETKEPIFFLTNISDLPAEEIAFIYKQRWEIEVFFKFLKQNLNLSHLVSRSANGIRVMIYMTLILSILLIAYKKSNNLQSYKIAKLKFSLELESHVVKEIVLLMGGDPSRGPHLFSDT